MSSKGVLFSCVLILVTLNCCVSAIQQLNSIDDLKRVFREKSLPLHSLTLLHWFANNVDFDNNNVARVSFNPNADFGSHYYSNFENLLAPVQRGYRYFSVGNVNRPYGNVCPESLDFPEYVIYPPVIENAYTGRNRDRIIISAQAQNYAPRRINQVFLTQHFRRQDNRGSGYDPDHTFQISPNLLQQLRLFSFNDNRRSLPELRNMFNQNIDNNQLDDIMNIWGEDQAPLGLLYLIVMPSAMNLAGVCSTSRLYKRDLIMKTSSRWQNCEIQQMHLDVITGGNGNAKILWRNVPYNQINEGVAVALFRNQMDTTRITYKKIDVSVGSYDTSESLNEGLQVRLHKTGWIPLIKEEICRGKEFQSPHAVSVTGYAQLQLFVRNGIGCFRLYIKKDCYEWTSDFHDSWVALYTSAGKDTDDYERGQWQWVTKFEQGPVYGEDNTFEYCTGTTVVPGLQARFIHTGNNEKARTPMWR